MTADPCTATVSERDGVVTLSIYDRARAARQTTFMLDGISYGAHFDAAGRLQAEAPMLHQIADLGWAGSGGRTCHRSGLKFSDFQAAVVIALVWNADVDLDLHVIEPSGHHVETQTFGESVQGTSRVRLYRLQPDSNPHDGYLYAFVEFASRGNPARAPFCGNDPQAVAAFKVYYLDGGKLDQKNKKFGSVACGASWSGDPEFSGYYQSSKLQL